jgi:hypothetical protein
MTLTTGDLSSLAAFLTLLLGAVAFVYRALSTTLRHLDTCIDSGKKENRSDFDTLKLQVNALHLEITKEYVRKEDLRNAMEDLRGEIAVSAHIRSLGARVERGLREGALGRGAREHRGEGDGDVGDD